MNRYHCRTNIDEGRTKNWPEDFVTCPRVGDYVCSESGYKLKVIAITHKTRLHPDGGGGHLPCIEVELGRLY